MSEIHKLVVRAGVARPAELTLLALSQARVGSSPDADLMVTGRYVSAEHCLLQRQPDGGWLLTNHSLNETLLNGQAVESRRLVPGDLIGLGPDVTLAVEGLARSQRSAGPSAAAAPGDKAEARPPRGGVAAVPWSGVAIVWVLCILGFLYKQMAPSGQDRGMNGEALATALAGTRACLASGMTGSGSPMGGGNDPADEYFALRALSPAERSQPRVEALSQRQGDLLRQGLLLERQQRSNDAAEAYRQAMELVPDPRCGGTAYAAQRRAALPHQSTTKTGKAL